MKLYFIQYYISSYDIDHESYVLANSTKEAMEEILRGNDEANINFKSILLKAAEGVSCCPDLYFSKKE